MNNTLITEDRLQSIGRLLNQAPISPYTYIAEVGVYKGGSLKYIAENVPGNIPIFGFDTFEGLPKEHWSQIELHKPGEFSDTSFFQVSQFISKRNVTLCKGLFPETAIKHFPFFGRADFSFIHVDTDFYQSVVECLKWFWPRLIPGGIMVFDDYQWPNCPGVEKALNEFKELHNIEILTGSKYQAHIIKPQ